MFINVEFESGGKEYCYSTPIEVTIGSYVLVNVYGNTKCAKVKEIDIYPPVGTRIKQIVGIGYLLEDLDATPKQESSLLSRLFGVN